MRIPPAPERIKEAPAQALRAVFAGVGQVLLLTERVRRRATGQDQGPLWPLGNRSTPAPAQPAAPVAPATAPAAATATATEAAAPPPAAAPEAPAPPAAAAPASEPVLPNYSELSIASLRARLRGLDTSQLRDLVEFEKAHENRANVITMFERRIAKLEEG